MYGLYSKENYAPKEDMLSFSSFPKEQAEIIWKRPLQKPQSVQLDKSLKHAVLCNFSYRMHLTSVTYSKRG